MRTVFTNDELPHLWAHARQSSGRNSGDTFYFSGDTIYSYGQHFPIARRLRHDLFALTTGSYSMTTTRHRSRVADAIPRNARILLVDNPTMTADAGDRQRVAARALQLLVRCARRRRPELIDQDLVEIVRDIDDFNAYAEAVGSSERVAMLTDGLMATSVEQLRTLAADTDARRKAEEAERQAAATKRLADKIERWKRGDTSVSSHELRSASVCLRLNHYPIYLATKTVEQVEVETSLGARITASEAIKLWPLIQRAIRGQRDYEPGTEIGGYTLVKIRRDGSVVIGCHDIPYPEIERIARMLGLEAKEVANA